MVTIIIPHKEYLSCGITLNMEWNMIAQVTFYIMLGQSSFSYFKCELQICGFLHMKDWQGHSEKLHVLTGRVASCICDTHVASMVGTGAIACKCNLTREKTHFDPKIFCGGISCCGEGCEHYVYNRRLRPIFVISWPLLRDCLCTTSEYTSSSEIPNIVPLRGDDPKEKKEIIQIRFC